MHQWVDQPCNPPELQEGAQRWHCLAEECFLGKLLVSESTPPCHLGERSVPAVLRPVYSGDGLLTGDEGGGTSTEVADFVGENDGTGEGVGGAASVKVISSPASAKEKG